MKTRFLTNFFVLFSLLLQSLAPILDVRAQEATPTVEPSVTETPVTETPVVTPVETYTITESETPVFASETPVVIETVVKTETLVVSPTESPTIVPSETPSLTPSQAATSGATVSATPFPTITATKTPSASQVAATASATVTASSSPTATLQPADGEKFQIVARTNPVYARAGEQVQLNWAISPLRDMKGYELVFAFAPGIRPVFAGKVLTASPDGSYRAAANLKGPIKLQIDEGTEAPFRVSVSLVKSNQLQSQAKLEVLEKQDLKAGVEQSATGLNGRVKVIFPQGSLSRDVSVFVQNPLDAEMPKYTLSGRPFQLNAYAVSAIRDESKGPGNSLAGMEEVKEFSRPVRIEVDYDPDLYAGNESQLYLYWYNTSTEQWEALPSYADPETHRLHALTTHFTIFDMGINHWQASQMPTVDSWQVDKFTGAATYSGSITIPPGPGGFQPEVGYSYHSLAMDQASAESQVSWLGAGWSIGENYIERNTRGTNDWEDDDTYAVNVAGISTGIVAIVGNDGGEEYRLQDENFWIVGRSGDDWVMADKQGNKYYFSKAAASVSINPKTNDFEWTTYRWNLAWVQNIFGQRITYSYAKETKPMQYTYYNPDDKKYYTRNATVVTATYPETISYASGLYRIRFIREDRNDFLANWSSSAVYNSYMRSRLKSIRVEAASGDSFTLIRQYVFTYADDSSPLNHIWPGVIWQHGKKDGSPAIGYTSTLLSIQERGMNGEALPATTFTYGDNMHLTQVDNGYGGKVSFVYERWVDKQHAAPARIHAESFGRAGSGCHGDGVSGWLTLTGGKVGCEKSNPAPGSNPMLVTNSATQSYLGRRNYLRPGIAYKLMMGVETGATGTQIGIYNGESYSLNDGNTNFVILPTTATLADPVIKATAGAVKVYSFQYMMLPTIYRVVKKIISEGAHTYEHRYKYEGAAMNSEANTSDMCPDISPLTTVWVTNCIDFAEKYSEFRGHQSVTETSPNGQVTITEYHQDEDRRGREAAITVMKDSANVLSKTIQTYTVTKLPVKPRIALKNVYLFGQAFACQDSCTYHGFSRQWVRNATAENHLYSNGAEIGSTKNIFTYEGKYGNLVKTLEQVNGLNYRQTVVEYFPNPTTQRVGLPGRKIVFGCSGACTEVLSIQEFIYDANTRYSQPPGNGKLMATRQVMGSQFTQVNTGYDEWGNTIKTTAYSGYGSIAAGNYTLPDGPMTTTTEYDSLYHAYPVSTTNALGHTTRLIYDPLLGLPIAEKAPSGAVMAVSYDGLGRITQVMYPGDVVLSSNGGDPFSSPLSKPVFVSANPSLTMEYHVKESGAAFWTKISQRVDAGKPNLIVKRYYDAIGRQFKQESGYESAGLEKILTVVDTRFDSPTKTSQSQPHAPNEAPVYSSVETILALQKTINTAFDGSQTMTTANGLETVTRDAAGRETRTEKDILGRAISVQPALGPGVTYTYDKLDRMLTATRGGATTRLVYDAFGRKQQMIDPDMGTWNYTYRADGQLLTQTDARGCKLALGYDPIGRLTSRTSSGACGAQVNVTYFYDQRMGINPGNLGQRTGMADSSGSASWDYDLRGRAVSETRQVGGVSALTKTTYNNANLPVSMTYPDGEVVTNTYNAQATLEKLSSSLGVNYTSGLTYDAAGRLTSRSFGSGLTQKLQYYAWNTPKNGGKLEKMVTGSGTWNAASFSFASNLQNLGYTYDAVGNINLITDGIANEKQAYTYDELYRLLKWQVIRTTDSKTLLNESYTYNPTTGNLATKAGMTLIYNDAAHVHAVSSTSTGNSYIYDANGSQTQRTINGKTFTLGYDAESRVVSVSGDGMTASFTYDGDGKQVKSVVNGETTVYFGPHYEVKNPGAGQVISKYYFAGNSRVAMRKYTIPASMKVEYFLADHLGSTALTTDATGKKVSEIKYKPWGETRSTWTDTAITATVSPVYQPTRYTFTGQRSYVADFGLHFYNARWYDSSIGRFAQADTIVPDGVQGLDRYAYVNNSPVMYTDPSGHESMCSGLTNEYAMQQCTQAEKDKKFFEGVDAPSTSGDFANKRAAYLTYLALMRLLGRRPTTEELVAMTAASEYYAYIHMKGAGNLRIYAQEALARNLYEACDGDTTCTDDQTYQFLSAYEPWFRKTNNATPTSRAQDILENTAENPYQQELADDVAQIMDDGEGGYATIQGWVLGMVSNRPWQWRNVDHAPSDTGMNVKVGAIMSINLGGGKGYFGDYFWVVTAMQNECYNHPTNPDCSVKKNKKGN